MREAASKPVYLADAYSDPVVVRVEGRACFLNSASLRDFVAELLRQGKCRFVLDLQNCASMDSTFLGVLAGAALELRKGQPPGSIVLARVAQRNLELIRNLGLHRLLVVDAGGTPLGFSQRSAELPGAHHSEIENARMILEAHEHLVAADEANRAKFQDVIAFLKNRAEQK